MAIRRSIIFGTIIFASFFSLACYAAAPPSDSQAADIINSSIGDFLIIGIVFIVLAFAFRQWLFSTRSLIVSEGYKPQYWEAKLIARLTILVGSVALVLGVIGCIVGVGIASPLASGQGFDPAQQMPMVAAAIGSVFSLQFALIGLLLAGFGLHLLVTADSANYSGGMLARMKAGTATPLPAIQVPQQRSTGKFCSGCGAAIVDDGSAFCAQCGIKLQVM